MSETGVYASSRPLPVFPTPYIPRARIVIKCANLNVTKILVCAFAILSILGCSSVSITLIEENVYFTIHYTVLTTDKNSKQ